MILLKPLWVRHEDNKPIFSVDIHPKGSRFATGGQGGQGGRIVIWNIAPVLSEPDESDPNIPKQLCQMDNHLGCVNVVRWSCQGHFLASGSDDKLVMIWKLTGEGSSTVFGGGGKVNIETWKCVYTLNSHTGDVLDLAWAPHDGWLASGSVDNTIIIWNAHKFPEKITVLKGHTAMVKGVTWDPVGKYIASQSDDKTLRVWRTKDWMQQEVITDAFTDCSATTHVLRLSWSPDGMYLVSAHAMNGGGPTAQIIERDGWKQDKDFVGHRKAVTCVRFNSNILKKFTPSSPKAQQYCSCAIGSRDRSISVWLTSLKRPLVVIKDVFDDSVLDISWSSNGLHLLACSWDGTVVCVIFNPNEIGVPLSASEKNSLYERMYGKSLQQNLLNRSFSGSQIIENPELLRAMEEGSAPSPKKDAMEVDEEAPTIVASPIQQESPKTAGSVLVPINQQTETRLPSGKRRITPMFLKAVPSTTTKENNLDVPTFNESSALSTSSPNKSKIVVVQETSASTSSGWSDAVASNVQIAPITNNQAKQSSCPQTLQISQLMCSEVPGDQPIVKFIDVMEPLKMATGRTVSKKVGTMKIQVTNSCQSISQGVLSRLDVFRNEYDSQPIWETYIGSTVLCVEGNRKLVVVCCEDFSINVFLIKSGARSLPPLLIEDVAASLTLSDNGVCLVLTKTGLIYMWDLEVGRSLLNRVSVRSLLTNKANVVGCSITSEAPLLTLSDGRAYLYSTDLHTWILLSNPLDPMCRTNGTAVRATSGDLPLASLQRKMSSHFHNENLPAGVKLSFLESQMSASNVLRSSAEFRYWLLATVNHLLEKGPECRLRAILDDLMGPIHDSARSTDEKSILGLSKRKLFEEILLIIRTKLPWQRLYKEYGELQSMGSSL
ncbi:hypothetical protein Trydic_g2841 [Trypoxylus dichotomus]